MSKFAKVAASLAAVPVLALSGSAFAGSPGQLAGGQTYLVKDLTSGGAYATSVSASCNDQLEYSMELSNTQFGTLSDVNLAVTLPSAGGTSTATATTNLGGSSGTSSSVTASLPSGATQSLENGTTILYDSSAHAIKTLPDSIASGGVDIGALNGSTTEFVNFKAKVNCPSTPTTPPPATTTTPPPTQLVNTGPGSTIAIFAGAAFIGALAYRLRLLRRASR